MDIQKDLDTIKQPIEVQKKKKEPTEKQLHALEQARKKRLENAQNKIKETKQEEELKTNNFNEKLKNLDKIDEILTKLNKLDIDKKEKLVIITDQDLPIEKPKVEVITELKEKTPLPTEIIKVEDTTKNPDEFKQFTNFNIKKKYTSGILQPSMRIPQVGKKNPFIIGYKELMANKY